MNEELMMQHSVQQLQPPTKNRRGLKVALFVLVTLLLIGGIGYGTALAWKKYSDVKANLSSEQSKNQSLAAKNSQLQQQLDAKSATPNITDTLPGGQTITYADTSANRNVLWWSADPTDANNIILSHKAYQQYLATVDSDMISSLCGTPDKVKAVQANIPYGTFNVTSKEVTPSEDQNCVQAIASTDNKDTTSRAAAQKVLDQVKTDIDAFVKAVTIQ